VVDQNKSNLKARHASSANCLPTLGTAGAAIELVRYIDWPPRAVTMRVLDVDGREVHSEIKGRLPGFHSLSEGSGPGSCSMSLLSSSAAASSRSSSSEVRQR
jgi:hypothetical protein